MLSLSSKRNSCLLIHKRWLLHGGKETATHMAVATEHNRPFNRNGKTEPQAGSQVATVWTGIEFQQLNLWLGQATTPAFGNDVAHDSNI